MTAQTKAPLWALVSVENAGRFTGHFNADPYADLIYQLAFDGEIAGNLRVTHNGEGACVTSIAFVEAHQGNDGAYITCLALKALYDNQTIQRERTGGSEDFEFVSEAFEFAGSFLTFEY